MKLFKKILKFKIFIILLKKDIKNYENAKSYVAYGTAATWAAACTVVSGGNPLAAAGCAAAGYTVGDTLVGGIVDDKKAQLEKRTPKVTNNEKSTSNQITQIDRSFEDFKTGKKDPTNSYGYDESNSIKRKV